MCESRSGNVDLHRSGPRSVSQYFWLWLRPRAAPHYPLRDCTLNRRFVYAEAGDLPFNGLAWDSELCGRAALACNPALAFGQGGLDGFSFTLGKLFLVFGEDSVGRSQPLKQ